MPGNNQPPAYSPSFNNPPSYSPSYNKPSYSPSYPSPSYSPSYPSNNYKPSYQQNSYSPSYSSRPSGSGFYGNNNYGNNNNYGRNNYGNTFGSGGLPGNTYISNNYYGSQQRSGFGGSGFLTNALFFGAGMHGGYMWGNRNSHNDNYNRRNWNEEEDRRWRSTTKAPYFDNKVPGSDVILPAAAVVGAATAFGLISLLPLNVPSQKPLMYCNQNASDILQTQILINGNVYECINDTITISNFNCLKLTSNQNITNSLNETTTTTTTTESTPVDNYTTSSIFESSTNSASNSCEEKSKTLHCDGDESIYCVNGTLLSRNDIFCNSTTFINGTVNLNQSMMILNCYDGLLAERQVASIPTTTTTQAPTTTTEKSLSFKSKVHVFLLRLIGQGDSMKKPETTTTTEEPEIPRQSVDETLPVWVPEALTIPPETTEPPTTTPKMFWALKNSSTPVDELIGSSLDSTYETNNDDTIFKFYTRLISTTETPTTTPKMIWMFKNETGIDSKAMTDTSFLDRAYEKDKNDPIFEIYTKVVSTTESSDKRADNSTATSV